MARPDYHNILLQIDTDACRIQILNAPAVYHLTYQEQPITIRKLVDGLGLEIKKYPRSNYDNEGSARAAVRRLNKLFNTDAFGYRRLL